MKCFWMKQKVRVSMNKFNTQEFRALQEEWYSILKDDGFKDVESESEREYGLVTKQTPTYDPERASHLKQCLEYYLRYEDARELGLLETNRDVLSKYKTLAKEDCNAFIFEKYCDGVSNRNITSLLESHGFKQLGHATVDRRILRILKDAEIEPYIFNK